MKLPQNPIFIVGYPRSGTTLLQRLLVSQPGLYTFPETHFFNVVERKIPRSKESETVPPSALPAVFAAIHEKMGIRYAHTKTEAIIREAQDGKLGSKALFEFIVADYLSRLYPGIENRSNWRWIEKTPYHANFLDRILDFYPQAQVLHILRHPTPAIFSCKRKFPFNKETPVIDLAQRWNVMLDNVDRFKRQYPNRIMTLRYEDLITRMELEMKQAAAFLGICFDRDRFFAVNHGDPDLQRKIILPSEPWKLADLGKELISTNEEYKSDALRKEAATIEQVIGERLEKSGYRPFHD